MPVQRQPLARLQVVVNEPKALSLMKKCSVALPNEYAELAYEIRCCQLIVTTKKGKKISVEIKMTPRDDARGMPKKILESKFNNLTKPFLKSTTREEILSLCWRINKMKSVGNLVTLTGIDET